MEYKENVKIRDPGFFFSTQDLPVCDIQPLRNLEETLKAAFRASCLPSGSASSLVCPLMETALKGHTIKLA